MQHRVIVREKGILNLNLRSENVRKERERRRNDCGESLAEMLVGSIVALKMLDDSHEKYSELHTSTALARSDSAFARDAFSRSERLVFFLPESTRF